MALLFDVDGAGAVELKYPSYFGGSMSLRGWRAVTFICSLGLLLHFPSTMRAQGVAAGDVFASGSPSGALMGAVRSLRQDAANGTGAPQLAAGAEYPSSLPKWNALRGKYPADAAAFQPCVDPLLEAFRELKQVGPLMSGKNYAAQVNAGVKRAKALVRQADDCIAKLNDEGLTATAGQLQQQAQDQTPRSGSDDFGSNPQGNGRPGGGGYPYKPPKYDPRRKNLTPHAPYTSATPTADMMKDCIEEATLNNESRPDSEVREICAQVVQNIKMNLAKPDCVVPDGSAGLVAQTPTLDGESPTPLCGGLKDTRAISVRIGTGASARTVKLNFDGNVPYFNGYIDGYGTRPIPITIDITREGAQLHLNRAISQNAFPNYLEGTITPVVGTDGVSLVAMKLEITRIGSGPKGQIHSVPPGKVANLFPSATRLVQPQWTGF